MRPAGSSIDSSTQNSPRANKIPPTNSTDEPFYFAPEVGLSVSELPRFELVVRVSHRFGGGTTLGHMESGYNADVIGVRYSL
jgi:hypothetical protein